MEQCRCGQGGTSEEEQDDDDVVMAAVLLEKEVVVVEEEVVVVLVAVEEDFQRIMAQCHNMYLGRCRLGCQGIKRLIPLRHNQSLSHLGLGLNDIGDSGVEALLPCLSDMHCLKW